MSLPGLEDSLQRKGYQKIHLGKKKLAPEDSGASSVGSMPYITLIPIVVMMSVVTVIAVSVGPVVCRPRIVAVVGSVIAVWIIAAVWIVTISVTRITKSDSDSPDANRNLSV